MKTFIAFFDIMGFKNIVNNNEYNELVRVFKNFMLDSQTAVSQGGKIEESPGRFVPDLDEIKVNCLHVFDKIIFWTNEDTFEDFEEIVKTSSTFYRRSFGGFFPLRGSLIHGEAFFSPFTINKGANLFQNSSFIGKGLVDSYILTESIEFSGCVIDKCILNVIDDQVVSKLKDDHIILDYQVPYKSGKEISLVFSPFREESISTQAFENIKSDIRRMFTSVSKMNLANLPESLTYKMNNTIEFIKQFWNPDKTFIPKPI